MRVLMVNWAPIREGALLGGGANGYLHDLALALQSRGHTVASLSGGLIHIPDNEGKQGPCSLRRVDDYRGIQAYEVVNSPVLAWSTHQFRHPLPEISSAALEAEVARFFRLWKPDIVHFHNIEAFTSVCPAIAQTPVGDFAGAKVVYSLHNYQTICPQVMLMHAGSTPCTHFDNGHRCETCYDAPHTHIVLEDRLRDSARKAKREDVFRPIKLEGVWSRIRWKPPPPIPLPARAVETEADVAPMAPSLSPSAQPTPTAATVNRTPHPASARPDVPLPVVVGGPLANVPLPEPSSALPPNDYALRRKAMIQMLSSCDRVLPVSEFVRLKFEAMGVKPRKMRTTLIGSRMPEVVRAFGPIEDPAPIFATREGERTTLSRPLRLAFLGYHNFYKGLHVLAAALELLPEWRRRQIDLSVHAKDVAPIVPWLRRLSLTMARVVAEDGYRYHDVPYLLRGVDLGVVPSVWWDNGPQTVMEFLACKVPVLASELGGIPDFIRDGHNGLLVPGNDPASLARAIERVMDGPSLLAHLRRGIAPPKDMDTHAAEIETIYTELVRASV